MNVHPPHRLLHPAHSAVIGTCRRPGSFGKRIFSALPDNILHIDTAGREKPPRQTTT
ncbi:hypothetical protein V6667_00970 [Neisseria leonii]|uniref:Uncharacterized protein n=1 Tax=Neisseria leonii TaxID=2995413 RepID=A0A9X4EAX0_9NEIS|nr:hypothetical protein [Neisseria sp. 51.81]MDD9328613.1 hypothetical protein [Neisseria sp. 51.81]